MDWSITNARASVWEEHSDMCWKEGDSWCIGSLGFASLLQKVGCENMHIRCDVTDVDYVMARYSFYNFELAKACLRKECFADDDSAEKVSEAAQVPNPITRKSWRRRFLGKLGLVKVSVEPRHQSATTKIAQKSWTRDVHAAAAAAPAGVALSAFAAAPMLGVSAAVGAVSAAVAMTVVLWHRTPPSLASDADAMLG